MAQELLILQNKTIFISKKLQADSPLMKLKSSVAHLVDESLIKITRIPFSFTPKAKWIFFSSKNAIEHFFAQKPDLLPGVRYGVLSKESAAFLSMYGKTADFIGEGVDLDVIAKNFRDVLKNDSVLFPQAMDSLQTIQKQISFSNNIYNLYTYKTILRTDFDLPHADILIFTSPSNVNAYLNKYTLDNSQTIIAMGKSTKYRLSENGVKNVLMPDSFGDPGLYQLLTKDRVSV